MPMESVLFAFLAGLTVAGIAASAMEFFSARSVSFREPFVTPEKVLRSLAAAALAGPFMLLNDALAARREGRVSGLALVSCACTSAAWLIATGVLVIALAQGAMQPLTWLPVS